MVTVCEFVTGDREDIMFLLFGIDKHLRVSQVGISLYKFTGPINYSS